MKILIIGSGGREHALAWRLGQDENIRDIFIAPGNAGMKEVATLINLDIKNSDEIADKSIGLGIELVIIGPEVPLVNGLVDNLEKRGLAVYGPSRLAARLEGSKIFSKKFMSDYNIPTARFESFDNYESALNGLSHWDFDKGVVLKADSLAAGKGVVVTHDKKEAEKTLYDFMINEDVSVKTSQILIEEKLLGKEVSAFALCDGNEESFEFLGLACDYKRVGVGDTGPNTGGMGGYAPKEWPGKEIESRICEEVIKPVLKGMKELGCPFKGTLFVGLMINDTDLNVVEFNVRFGDPETQILMPLIKGNFSKTLLACAKGELNTVSKLSISQLHSVHVVLASGGYPSIDQTPLCLERKINIEKSWPKNAELFYAGVQRSGEILVNSGGRVLGVTGIGDTLEDARKSAYLGISKIKLADAHWRDDIAK